MFRSSRQSIKIKLYLHLISTIFLLGTISIGCNSAKKSKIINSQPLKASQTPAPSMQQVFSTPIPSRIKNKNGNILPSLEKPTNTSTRMPTRTPALSDISGYVVYDYIVDVIDFTYQIFLVNLETREIKRLTNEGSNSSPAWSPDGTKIVFSSSRNGDNDLYIMDREGTNQQQITDLDGNELVPDWSPDGESIAFLSTYEGAEGIYVVDVSSRTISQLTHNLVDFSPRWSSNGKKIVFTSHLDTTATYEPSQIYVMNEDGSQVQQLTNDKYRNISPFWCPDDSCVVYERYTGEGNIRKLMVFDLVSYEAKPLLTGAYETKSTSSEFCNSRSPIRGYFTIILEESMVYAFDIKNNRLYSLGIQAMNVSLFP